MATQKGAIVDLGDTTTWPRPIRVFVEGLATRVVRHPDYRPSTPSYELRSSSYEEDAAIDRDLRVALKDAHLRTYHASRLLPHEVERLWEEGLRPLSDDLRASKLQGAVEYERSVLSEIEAAMLQRNGPLSWRGHGMRRGQLWVVAPLTALDALEGAGGFEDLLGRWGGESIAWAAHGANAEARKCSELIDRLSAASSAAVVEVGVEPSTLCTTKPVWPVMVGALLGQPEPWNEWWIEGVERVEVLDVIQPGHPRWRSEWLIEGLPATTVDHDEDERAAKLADRLARAVA